MTAVCHRVCKSPWECKDDISFSLYSAYKVSALATFEFEVSLSVKSETMHGIDAQQLVFKL